MKSYVINQAYSMLNISALITISTKEFVEKCNKGYSMLKEDCTDNDIIENCSEIIVIPYLWVKVLVYLCEYFWFLMLGKQKYTVRLFESINLFLKPVI